VSPVVATEEHTNAGLLHNMSHRPTACASRKGVHRTRLVRIPIQAVLALHRAQDAGPRTLCARVGVKPKKGQTAEDALSAWADRHLDAVDFPRVAAVVPDKTPGAVELRRAPGRLLAIAIAVATRSTGKVFLREKSPLWSRLHAEASVVLALPETLLDEDAASGATTAAPATIATTVTTEDGQ
jgi:hypothetical protein